jgi:hypothetical protein
MAARVIQTQVWTRLERVLKNAAVAEKGQVACIDTSDGSLVPASVSLTLLPIGVFESSATGDGVATIFVRLFAPVEVVPMVSSATGPVADDDVGSLTFLHSATDVSMTGTGKSVAGRVWGLVGSGAGATVYVELAARFQG